MSKDTPPRKRSFVFRLFRFLLIFVLIIAALGVAGIAGTYYYFSRDLPKLDKIEDYKPPLVTEVFDTDNNKIGEFWSECRFLTPIKDIPDKLIKGFVASEDERFFAHHGVDPWGIVRAMVTNLKAGHTVQGGSTITQQVAKNLVLSPERSFDRKVKEAIIATKIESRFTKDQILYLYLNQIFFGNRAYGVAAAARNYFHKNLKDLNIAEIAMIVGLSKAPTTFNPIVNPERARIRQHYVIDRMLEQGYITKQEAADAKAYQLVLYKAGTDKDFNLQYTPYFTEHVRRYLQDKYGDDALYRGGWKVYTTTNIDIYQAAQKAVVKGVREVDRRQGFHGPSQRLADADAINKFNIQNQIKILEEAGKLERGLHKNTENFMNLKTPLEENHYYDAVILNGSRSRGFEAQVGNAKGTILSETMSWAPGAENLKPGDVIEVKIYQKKVAEAKKGAKGKTTTEEPKTASPITTETDHYQFSLEQAPDLQGALYSYEPFTGEVKAIIGGTDYNKSEFNRATQALRQPGSSIKPLIYSSALDKGYTPNTIIMDAPIVYEESPGKFWTPKNYGGGYSGPTPLRSALVHSLNVVTVRIVMDVGTHYIDAYMRKLGLTTPIFKYYSMALGANDVILAEIARSYGTFTTGGILPETFFIKKIVDPTGKVVEENHPMADKKFVITWDEKKQATETAPAALPSTTSSKGQDATGHAAIPESQQASAESNPAESQPTAKVETKPEKGKNSKVPWDEMGYSPQLIGAGEEWIKKDQLSLSDYEKKILYGSYIPQDHVISPRTAVTMVSLMQDVVKYGTATTVLPLGKPAAGKTGTTNGATDAWFIGYTPTLAAGVWVGHDEKIKTIGHGATGGHVSAPIWLYYMQEATKHYPTKDFKVPSWIDLSQYQRPMELVKGDSEASDFAGTIPGAGGGPAKGGSSGAEFFTKDL
ncbi:MAG: PBP1A family penicillin-binding protein [bacterium]